LQDFAIRGLFACGDEGAAHQLLRAALALDGFSGLGFVPEHLVGDRALAPARGVPHQIFSSSTILSATLAGELGLACEAGVLRVRPTPVCDRARFALERVRVGESSARLEFTRETHAEGTQLTLTARLLSGSPFELELAPRWPHGSIPATSSARAKVGAAGTGDTRLSASAALGPALFVPARALARGEPSSRPRVARAERGERAATWTVWGLAGRRERLTLLCDRRVAWHGARACGPHELEADFGAGSGFVARTVRAEFLD
jgi:hypothetical protein